MPSGRRHYRLTLADALSAHDKALELGGRPGIPNLGMVESAIARPYTGYYHTISHKAAALVESMATNHGFADGNKRSTVLLMHVLLDRSGYALAAAENGEGLQEALEMMIMDVVEHRMDIEGLVEWFKRRICRP